MKQEIGSLKGSYHHWSRADWEGKRRCLKCGAQSQYTQGSSNCPVTLYRKPKLAAQVQQTSLF